MTAKALHTRWVSVGHAAMETQGARPGGETPACEVAGPSGSYSIACSGHRGRMRVRGPGPPNSPRGGRLSQEHFLLPHGGRVGALEAVFAALLPAQRTEKPC